MNVLWEMAAAERVLIGILERVGNIVHGVTCGAGMPYRVAEIAARFGVHYYPIVSSGRAFRALWKRAYHKYAEMLGGVVYEDPWRAGGHNGLSNSEDPEAPEDPFPRVRALRDSQGPSTTVKGPSESSVPRWAGTRSTPTPRSGWTTRSSGSSSRSGVCPARASHRRPPTIRSRACRTGFR